ncbi:MAG: hypothetical protein MUC89_00100 [Acetobacteraceae bacterium]|jgi:hypothetical protein|nr:hypothetical protein [Acetobacteraceae bacterium]
MTHIKSAAGGPPTLFEHEGKVLLMGCETAQGPECRAFLIVAGTHYLTGHGGFVGGPTMSTRAPLSDVRLPAWAALVLFGLDAKGNVIARQSTKPKLFGVF